MNQSSEISVPVQVPVTGKLIRNALPFSEKSKGTSSCRLPLPDRHDNHPEECPGTACFRWAPLRLPEISLDHGGTKKTDDSGNPGFGP